MPDKHATFFVQPALRSVKTTVKRELKHSGVDHAAIERVLLDGSSSSGNNTAVRVSVSGDTSDISNAATTLASLCRNNGLNLTGGSQVTPTDVSNSVVIRPTDSSFARMDSSGDLSAAVIRVSNCSSVLDCLGSRPCRWATSCVLCAMGAAGNAGVGAATSGVGKPAGDWIKVPKKVIKVFLNYNVAFQQSVRSAAALEYDAEEDVADTWLDIDHSSQTTSAIPLLSISRQANSREMGQCVEPVTKPYSKIAHVAVDTRLVTKRSLRRHLQEQLGLDDGDTDITNVYFKVVFDHGVKYMRFTEGAQLHDINEVYAFDTRHVRLCHDLVEAGGGPLTQQPIRAPAQLMPLTERQQEREHAVTMAAFRERQAAFRERQAERDQQEAREQRQHELALLQLGVNRSPDRGRGTSPRNEQ